MDIKKIVASEDMYLKLKAMDALLYAKSGLKMEIENIAQLIDTLIDNHKTREYF